jgi:hypothetical protein
MARVELWTSFRTPRFEEDAAILRLDAVTVGRWEYNIRRHPLIGTPVDEEAGIGARDYEVEGHLVRYLMNRSRREIDLMTIRPASEVRGRSGDLALRAWRGLIDVATILGVFR